MAGALVLTGVAAALYAAAFPPLSITPLAWVALVPLLAAAVRVSPLRAGVCGAVFGVVMAYGVGTWFPGMVRDYFEQPLWVGWLGFFLTSVVSASIYYGPYAAWVSWLVRRGRAGPCVLVAGWGVCEMARGRLLLQNPWALLGYSQAPWPPALQVADIAGVYGVGMLVAAGNVLVAMALVPALRLTRRAPAVAMVTLMAAALGYGYWRLASPIASGAPFTVAVVQGAIERGFAWRPEYRSIGVSRYVGLTRNAAAEQPALVVWPESAVSFYMQEDVPEQRQVLEMQRELGVDLILGGPHYEYVDTATRYHNSVFVARGGRVTDRYDKLLLLPLAEESSLGSFFRLKTGMSPGSDIRLLDTGPARVGAFVCWESMHPAFVRRFVAAGATVLVNLSNDSWFGAAAASRHHVDMAILRAVETRRFLVRAATTGYSAIVDPQGRVVTESRRGEAAVLVGRIASVELVTTYQWWGDAVVWIALALAIVSSARAARGNRQSHARSSGCSAA